VIRRRPLVAFFLLAFGISWGVPGLALLVASQTGLEVAIDEYSPLSYVALWGPAMAAFLVVGVRHGGPGLRAYLRRLLHWRAGWGWYLAILVGIPLVNLLAAMGMEWRGVDAVAWPTIPLGALVVAALLRATEGPMEEIGWRGFALPMLQRRFSGFGASLVLGLLWALWHLPAIVLGRAVGGGIGGGLVSVLAVFVAMIVAQSLLLTVVYNGTRGSIPMAILFHWMTNWPYPWETGADLAPVAAPLWIVVALVVVTIGRRYLGRSNLQTDVLPERPGRSGNPPDTAP
jgi:hypothetical protein